MKLIKIISSLAALSAAGSVLADGPHFTLTVPLALNSLPPEVNAYDVSCTVYQGVAPKGTGQTSGPISGGSFTGDVAVPVTVVAPNNPALVDQYACSLHLNGTVDGRPYVFMDDSNTRFPLNSTALLRKWIGPVPIPH